MSTQPVYGYDLFLVFPEHTDIDYVYEERDVKLPMQLQAGMTIDVSFDPEKQQTFRLQVTALHCDMFTKRFSARLEVPRKYSNTDTNLRHAQEIRRAVCNAPGWRSWEKKRHLPSNFPERATQLS